MVAVPGAWSKTATQPACVTAAVFQVIAPLKLGAATPVLPLLPLVDVEPEDPDEPLVDPDALPDEPELLLLEPEDVVVLPLFDDALVVLLPEPALVPTLVLPEFPAGLVPDPPQPLTSAASAAAKMAEPFRTCD